MVLISTMNSSASATSLPTVDRRHRRQDVDAGGELAFDQGIRESAGFGLGAGGSQDDSLVSHIEFDAGPGIADEET